MTSKYDNRNNFFAYDGRRRSVLDDMRTPGQFPGLTPQRAFLSKFIEISQFGRL